MRSAVVLALSLAACGGASPVARGLDDPEAFARLAAIAGDWTATTDSGGTVTVTYRLVSRGTALVEDWTTPSGVSTVTVYHPDHATVLLTHYCAQGNQARLRLVEASPGHFRFERFDVTNALPGQSILTILVLDLEDGAIARTETYVDENGAPDETTLRLTRRASPE